MQLEAFLKAPEYRYGVLNVWSLYQYRLEPSFKRSVLLDVVPVLFERGRSYAVQLSSCQHGFQHVAGIDRALCFPCSDNGMELVNEEDDLSLALLDFIKHCLEPLFEFTPVFGTGKKRSHVEREDGSVLQPFGYVASVDPHCQSFNYRCLTDSWFSNKHRVVLCLATQYPYYSSYFFVTADYRVEPVLASGPDQIPAVFFKHFVSVLRVVRSHPLVAADIAQGLKEIVPVQSEG